LGATTVKVSLANLEEALESRRKFLVKQRRNMMSQGAAARRKGDTTKATSLGNEADWALRDIRVVDHQLGLLKVASFRTQTYLVLDVLGGLEQFGFGLDENGSFPAL